MSSNYAKGESMSKKITRFSAVISIALLIIGLIAGVLIGSYLLPNGQTAGAKLTGEIPIGYLADDDYVYLQLGQKYAIQIVQDDINNYWQSLGLNATVKFITENAGDDEVKALAAVQTMAALGCKATVGWGWTSMIKAADSFVNTNHILLVSAGATGLAEAIPNDYIYRCRGSDGANAIVTARMMITKGIKAVAALHVGDSWGDGFWPMVQTEFQRLGGVVVSDIRFSKDATEFSSEVSQTATAVTQAIGTYTKAKVAVLLIAYPQHQAAILNAAASYPNLLSVLWFGSNGTVYNTDVIRDAGEIAAETVNYSPNEAFKKTPKYEVFRQKFHNLTGTDPVGISAANLYDAAWVIALTITQLGVYDGVKMKDMFPTVCDSFFGIVGWMHLDAAGDRAYQDYEIGMISKNATTSIIGWSTVGYYDLASDTLTWY